MIQNITEEKNYLLKRNLKLYNDIELASAYYILNRSAFSGGSLVAGFSKEHYQKTFTEDRIKDLSNFAILLKDVRITNLDYQKVIEVPSKYYPDNVFVMCDPPYRSATDSGLYGKGGNRYINLHKSFDHDRFSKTMKKCEYRYLITYDDSPFIKKLFPFAQQKSWTFVHKMRKDKIGKELLLYNYKLKCDTVQTNIEDAWL